MSHAGSSANGATVYLNLETGVCHFSQFSVLGSLALGWRACMRAWCLLLAVFFSGVANRRSKACLHSGACTDRHMRNWNKLPLPHQKFCAQTHTRTSMRAHFPPPSSDF